MIVLTGHGLHSGLPARLVLRPAPADHGIWFRRVDVTDRDNLIAARWDMVRQSPLCTLIQNAGGVSVSTIEHVMAALAGCGVHNALIDIDGPEVPILDGSAVDFVRAILAAGLTVLDAPVRAIEVLKPVSVQRGDAMARLDPGPGLRIDFRIDFADPAIGVQSKTLNMANGSFVRELCDSRTFCRKADVDAMRAQGLALGGTLENAVVVDGAQVLSPGGLRHVDEAVRHKMLDALGDLALAAAPLIGLYSGNRAGHALTNDLLRALFADPTAWRRVDCDPVQAASLPGAGVHAGELPAVA
jgi:UDP-3-O-[3-hydroxymyristoyl] N-acetylglucosamine deacetylase